MMGNFFCKSAQYKALALQGKDAQDFLHRLATINIKNMQPGASLPGLLLTNTGKLIAAFLILQDRCEENIFYIFSEAACFEAMKNYLESLHFSEDIQFAEITIDTMKKLTEEERLTLTTKLSEQERIAAMIPLYGKEWSTETFALDAGFLHWIDRTKGCYPGQEAIEKTLNIGHPPRTLVLLKSKDIAPEKTELFLDNAKVGHITSTVSNGKEFLSLAIVRWSARTIGTVLQAESKKDLKKIFFTIENNSA